MLAARRAGATGREVHLGYWDEPAAPPAPGDFARAQQRLTDLALAHLPLAPGHAVLDVGCGFGAALAALDAHNTGLTLIGLNIDLRQLTLCRDAVQRPQNTLHLVAA